MEFVIELVFEIYVELMFLIVPEKNASKKQILIAKIIAVCVQLVLFALLVVGVVLLVDYNNMWGVALIAVAVALSLSQIIAGIVSYKKNH